MVNATTEDDRKDKKPISRVVTDVLIDYSEDNTTGETDITVNGRVDQIILNVPDLTSTHTMTLNILDEDGAVLYTASGKAESTIHVLHPTNTIELCGTTTLQVVASSAETADSTTTVTLYLK